MFKSASIVSSDRSQLVVSNRAPTRPIRMWSDVWNIAEAKTFFKYRMSLLKEYYKRNRFIVHMVKPDHFTIPLVDGNAAGNHYVIEGSKKFNQYGHSADNTRSAIKSWNKLHGVCELFYYPNVLVYDNDIIYKEKVDAVFARDPFISFKMVDMSSGSPKAGKAVYVMSKFGYKERQGEEIAYYEKLCSLRQTRSRRTVESIESDPIFLQSKITLEGGNIVIDSNRGLIICGVGERGDKKVVDLLKHLTGMDVMAVKNKGKFFHLDLAVSFLQSGQCIYCAEAFDDDELKLFKEKVFHSDPDIEEEYGIRISSELAEAFVANILPVADNCIIHNVFLEYLRSADFFRSQYGQKRVDLDYKHLENEGKEVLSRLNRYYEFENQTIVDIELFEMAGGGVHCLTNNHNLIFSDIVPDSYLHRVSSVKECMTDCEPSVASLKLSDCPLEPIFSEGLANIIPTNPIINV